MRMAQNVSINCQNGPKKEKEWPKCLQTGPKKYGKSAYFMDFAHI